MLYETEEAYAILDQMGFAKHGAETRTDGIIVGPAVTHYQRAFAGNGRHDHLVADGVLGEKTWRTIDHWEGMLSPHFAAVEFVDRRHNLNGVRRELVHALQVLRRQYGPIAILSGYRTSATNASLPGAARQSQHLFGLAADVHINMTVRRIAALHLFSGIGYVRATKGRKEFIRHLDVRHAGSRNVTNSTPTNPAVWRY